MAGGPADQPEPLKPGDRVGLRVDGQVLLARVCVIGQWSHIVARSDDGRLWIEVVMNLSAVSWTRLVQLADSVDIADEAHLAAIAQAISWRPRRDDVADVPGAVRLCAPGDGIGERL